MYNTIKENKIEVGCERTMLQNHSNISEVKRNISSPQITYPSMMKVPLLPSILCALFVLISPSISSAQLPNLGTAIHFGLFTATGALGNTGTSNITGNIGTHSGAITGFEPPTVVNGTIELANNATTQCSIDVKAAYAEILSRTPTNDVHAPVFGNQETLQAGVYAIGAAGSIAGTLTLDAKGVPDTTFIFKFGGAFTTAASSKVTLINGASACNIFWIADGAIAMAALTDMKGTLIANGGAISMGAGGTIVGRMLSTVGEASVYNVILTVPDCLNSPLPINLLSFTGHCDQHNIVLKWSTSSEINNDYFTIEHSANGINWHIVGIVAGSHNSSSPLHYSLTDKSHYQGTSYYRLKQTDFHGSYSYSPLIVIPTCENIAPNPFTIFPNPSNGKFKLLYNGPSSDIHSIDIYNEQGERVYKTTNFQSRFDLSHQPPGLYVLRVAYNDEIIKLKFILVATNP